MSVSSKLPVLLAVLLLPAACKDSPTEVDPGPPTVTFQIVDPRPTVVNQFDATRRGENLTLLGTMMAPCVPFSTVGEAWHEDDTLYIEFTNTEEEGCVPEEGVMERISYTAKVTAAAGSSRLRVIHGWPSTGLPPDTVFRAVFRAN